jgi:hypothetical protein
MNAVPSVLRPLARRAARFLIAASLVTGFLASGFLVSGQPGFAAEPATSAPSPATAPPRPNIVFILADDK